MVRNRTGLAPWSLSREAGIESATVDGTIEVPQSVQPTIDTGFVDEKGNWKGVKSDDKDFIALHLNEAIANGGTFLTPDINSDGTWPLDMTGYHFIFLAIKPSNGGNIGIEAVMGPDAINYANLSPVNPATTLRGNEDFSASIEDLMKDSSETCVVDVWNIFRIDRMQGQKLLQFKLTNSSGGISTIETAFMRMV